MTLEVVIGVSLAVTLVWAICGPTVQAQQESKKPQKRSITRSPPKQINSPENLKKILEEVKEEEPITLSTYQRLKEGSKSSVRFE